MQLSVFSLLDMWFVTVRHIVIQLTVFCVFYLHFFNIDILRLLEGVAL